MSEPIIPEASWYAGSLISLTQESILIDSTPSSGAGSTVATPWRKVKLTRGCRVVVSAFNTLDSSPESLLYAQKRADRPCGESHVMLRTLCDGSATLCRFC